MVSRVRMSNGEIRPGIVEQDSQSSNSSSNIVLSQGIPSDNFHYWRVNLTGGMITGRKVTPFISGSPTRMADHASSLDVFQEVESQESSQHQYESQSQSQGTYSSQPPLEPTSQADSDFVETPLMTPTGSTECIVLETSTLPESQMVFIPSDSQDIPMEDVSESQMGILESQSQSQLVNSDVEMEGPSAQGQSVSPPSITVRTTPSTSFSSPTSGKNLFCASPSRLFRRGSHSRASSRGLQSPTLKRKRGSSFENEKRYHLRSKDSAIPPTRNLVRSRSSLPALPSFQEPTEPSPPHSLKRTPSRPAPMKGGSAISRTASHTRAKGKGVIVSDASSRPLRRSTRTRHSVGARVGA